MTKTAQLDALIMRNIADIEDAFKRACEILTLRLSKEIETLYENFLKSNLFFNSSEDMEDNYFSFEDWKASDYAKEQNCYLGVFISCDFDDYSSWPGLLTGAREYKTYLKLYSDFWGQTNWKGYLRGDKSSNIRDLLVKTGFQIDQKEGAIRIPFRLNAETVAKALETDDFDEALKPIRIAIEKIISTKAIFDEIAKFIKDDL